MHFKVCESVVHRRCVGRGVRCVRVCAAAAADCAWSAPAPQGGGGGRGGGAAATGLFTAVDANKDGATTRDEMRSTFERWFGEWDSAKAGTLSQEQIAAGLAAAMPAPAIPAGGGRGAGGQNQTPQPQHVEAMVAALPATAPAKPKQPRKVLVLGKAGGFVHSSIPLAGRTVDELGKKTGAWTTTITYDPADITEQNLKQYDAIFLASTTGAFLDDRERRGGDGGTAEGAARVRARRQRARRDSRRHRLLPSERAVGDAAGRRRACGARCGCAWGGSRGTRRLRRRAAARRRWWHAFIAQGDKNSDQRLSKDEFVGLADVWYGKLDTANAGRVSQADFVQRYTGAILPTAPARQPPRLSHRPVRAAPATRTSRRLRSSGPTTRLAPGPSSTR